MVIGRDHRILCQYGHDLGDSKNPAVTTMCLLNTKIPANVVDLSNKYIVPMYVCNYLNTQYITYYIEGSGKSLCSAYLEIKRERTLNFTK